MAVANGGYPFTQRDVVTEIYGDSSNRSLTELFYAAIGTFDSAYEGSKNSLYNFRNYQHIIPNGGYGRLYNYYAMLDSRNIAPTGWHIPTLSDMATLINGTGGETNAGGNLKEIGNNHWISPNTGASNYYGFTAVAGGYREYTGNFIYIKKYGFIGIPTYYNTTGTLFSLEIYHHLVRCSYTGGGADIRSGVSVRLIKDDSTDTGIMTDNSGYTYKTVKIGNQVWMASNLRGTKYRNGDNIPVVTDNATWAGLSTGACCSYNNNDAWSYDENYVLNDIYVGIGIDYIFDGTNYKMYAYSNVLGTSDPILVNTDVTITFNYSYYDENAGRSFNVSLATLTIQSGQSQSSLEIIGGYFTSLSPLNVYPTINGTYHYTIN